MHARIHPKWQNPERSTGPGLKDPFPRMDGLGAAGCITEVRETTVVTP